MTVEVTEAQMGEMAGARTMNCGMDGLDYSHHMHINEVVRTIGSDNRLPSE